MQVAAQLVEPAVDGMDVGILEARQDRSALKVDDPGARTECAATAASGPTATIRPSRTASALAERRAASIVRCGHR